MFADLKIICPAWLRSAILNNERIKTVDFITWLVSEGYATTEKPLNQTATIDLHFKGFENKIPKKAYFDSWGRDTTYLVYFS